MIYLTSDSLLKYQKKIESASNCVTILYKDGYSLSKARNIMKINGIFLTMRINDEEVIVNVFVEINEVRVNDALVIVSLGR